MAKNRILVIDDEESIRKLLKSRFEREGYEVLTATQGEEGVQTLRQSSGVGVVVTDLRMPGVDGFEFLERARMYDAKVRTIVITGHGEKEAAVRALRDGAADYFEKPFEMEDLVQSVKRAFGEYRMALSQEEMVERLEARVQRVEGRQEDSTWYVSKANSMAKVNEWLNVLRRESMRGDAEEPTVLIQGESGTGKEGVARMVHAGSRRARGPWVAVNCANFSEQLLESELFGHEKGSFTGATGLKRGLFEIARGGTLFLDELGEMEIRLQAKLLRVLQEKVFRRVGGTSDIETEVRVIAATNSDLPTRVSEGRFRDDLYHRLSRVVIEIPPLRNRPEDVIPMATQFAERAYRLRGKDFQGFTTEAEAQLQSYPWPGNVRELLNVMERSALLAKVGETRISAQTLHLSERGVSSGRSSGTGTSGATPQLTLIEGGSQGSYMDLKKKWVDSFESEYLRTILREQAGNVSAAARLAQIDRSNFLRLLRRHQIKAQDFRKIGSSESQVVAEPQMVETEKKEAA
jgi:two-component system nitrogen regulation response regulator NtrX